MFIKKKKGSLARIFQGQKHQQKLQLGGKGVRFINLFCNHFIFINTNTFLAIALSEGTIGTSFPERWLKTL